MMILPRYMRKTVMTGFVDVLNEALKRDKEAVRKLCEHRVVCNRDLASHPEIQVRGVRSGEGGSEVFEVGMLGIINGICERETGFRVAAEFDSQGNLTGFKQYSEE